jgi:hypothetical protein
METILITPFPVLAMASWAAAIMMLTRSWLRSTAARRSTMDGPELLLTAAVSMLPERCRRKRDGVEAAVWLALVGGTLIFAVHTVIPLLGFQLDAALLDDGYPPRARPDLGVWLPMMLGREIGGGIFALLLLPGWAQFAGFVAGAVGSAAREGFDEPVSN